LPNTKWIWLKAAERAKRDGHIRELYAMGWTKQEIAERYDITPQRVYQIVRKP
jgi:Mor family transcriptional regulator